jgi:AcrR family transcriptional regulator
MKHKQEDEVIYGTALKTFSKFGYRKTTLEDIAGELGMTAAGIYAYASSKQELYEGTVRFAMHRWQEYVGEHIAKEKSARDKLIAMCRSALSYLTKDRQFLRLLEKDPAIFPMFPTADPYEDINSDSIRMISEHVAYCRTAEDHDIKLHPGSYLFEDFRAYIDAMGGSIRASTDRE